MIDSLNFSRNYFSDLNVVANYVKYPFFIHPPIVYVNDMEYLLAESNIFCISFRVCHSNEVMTVAMSNKNRSQIAIFPYIFICIPLTKIVPMEI